MSDHLPLASLASLASLPLLSLSSLAPEWLEPSAADIAEFNAYWDQLADAAYAAWLAEPSYDCE